MCPMQGVNLPPIAITEGRRGNEEERKTDSWAWCLAEGAVYKVYTATGEGPPHHHHMSLPNGSWTFDVDTCLNTVHLPQSSLAFKMGETDAVL